MLGTLHFGVVVGNGQNPVVSTRTDKSILLQLDEGELDRYSLNDSMMVFDKDISLNIPSNLEVN
ncbi:hypothetical protein FWK35_00014331 [Aphis craccivora]|uniref:Uncharacterized protein n=1 Tax=Aphis craccivora TaxID=307492 RepID=A0A6G0YI60_APHCR|nr:hypothetical protein FWK35_00014331 [Aphis craccivora]